MKKYALNIFNIIQACIKYAPAIMVIVEALKMVQSEIKKISEKDDK